MTPRDLLSTSLIVFLVAFALIVLWQIYTGHIGIAGLLRDKRGQGFSPARFQLLLATLAGLAVYAEEQLTATGGTAPPMPDWLVWSMVGSQGLYLTGKSTSHFGLRALLDLLKGKA